MGRGRRQARLEEHVPAATHWATGSWRKPSLQKQGVTIGRQCLFAATTARPNQVKAAAKANGVAQGFCVITQDAHLESYHPGYGL